MHCKEACVMEVTEMIALMRHCAQPGVACWDCPRHKGGINHVISRCRNELMLIASDALEKRKDQE